MDRRVFNKHFKTLCAYKDLVYPWLDQTSILLNSNILYFILVTHIFTWRNDEIGKIINKPDKHSNIYKFTLKSFAKWKEKPS